MPAVGTIVKYSVTQPVQDALFRTAFRASPKTGDVLPALVVADNGAKCNLQVFLDGPSRPFFLRDINAADLVA